MSGVEDASLSEPKALTAHAFDRDGVRVLALAGEIDLSTCRVLERALEEVVEEQPSKLVLDLSAVTFMSSAGIRSILHAHDTVSANGQFALVADGPATTRPLELMGIDQTVAVYPTLDDAVLGIGSD